MHVKAVTADALAVSEILELLELFRCFSMSSFPDWKSIRQRISDSEILLLYRKEQIIGCVLVEKASRYMDGAAILAEFIYRWDCNEEADISAMLGCIAAACCERYSYLLLDVDRRHELNLACYQRFGFQNAIWPSPKGKGNQILIVKLKKK